MMRKIAIVACVILVLSSWATGFAQSLIHSKLEQFRTHPDVFGRDFWLVEMPNQWGQSFATKQLRLFIASSNNTTAYVSCQGKTTPLPISAYSVSSFVIPENWEMESSGILEHKAIHVWSNDADLTVYSMNENAGNGTEGERIIPTIGWGTDYVIAAFSSFTSGFGNYIFDLPSIMAIVADQDNTTVTITPSCPCRTGGQTILRAGVPFTITMNRGDSYQLMPQRVTDTGFDLTGTIVHASSPIGVFGGSVSTFIPINIPYANRVEEMMLPVNHWGTMYFGSTFHHGQPSSPSADSALYLLVSTVPDQTIVAHHCGQPDEHFTLGIKFGTLWTEQSSVVSFTSDSPFECVEYSNSSLYPDNLNASIYPTETILTPREEFSTTVKGVAPTAGDVFQSSATIVVNTHDETHILFDGKPLTYDTAACLGSEWEVFTIDSIAGGLHQVTDADSGTTMTIYGYGDYESYSWSSTSAIDKIDYSSVLDTLAPIVDTSGSCMMAFFHLSDSGGVNSGIFGITIDSQDNMEFADTNFVANASLDTTGYNLMVFDPTRPAFLQVGIYDGGGNEARVTSTYTPQSFALSPSLQNVGAQIKGQPANVAFDTIINSGTVPISLSDIYLLNGNRGFSLFDSIGGPLDRSILLPSMRRIIQVRFVSKSDTTVLDTLVVGNGCVSRTAVLVAAGGRNDFLVTSQRWPVEPPFPPDSGYIEAVEVLNLSPGSIQIDSASWSDRVHFIPAEHGDGSPYNTFPMTLPPAPSMTPFYIGYFSDANSLHNVYKTQGVWTSPQVTKAGTKVPHFDSLTTGSITFGATMSGDTTVNDTCLEVGSTIAIPVTITAPLQNPITISRIAQRSQDPFFQPLIGTLPYGIRWDPSSSAQTLLPGETATIIVRYVVPSAQSFTTTDTIMALDSAGDPISDTPVIVQVQGLYRQFTVPATFDLGLTPFQKPPKTGSFLLTNSGSSPLEVDAVVQEVTKYYSAFSLTTVPEFPAFLQPGDSMRVNITYNDSLFSDPQQDLIINYISKACNFHQTVVRVEIGDAGIADEHMQWLNADVRTVGNRLDILTPDNTDCRFELLNVLGDIVLREDVNTSHASLDIRSLPTGVYFWRISSDKGSKTGKILFGE